MCFVLDFQLGLGNVRPKEINDGPMTFFLHKSETEICILAPDLWSSFIAAQNILNLFQLGA